jgi:hypothetical protein
VRARIPAPHRVRLRLPDPARRVRVTRVLVVAAVAAAIVYSMDMRPTADIADTPVVASRVLVLRDTSGSMDNTGPILANQMRAALVAGIEVVASVETKGFGFSAAGDGTNALLTLTRVLPGLDVDALYLFSDYDNQTGSLDNLDADGLMRLERLLADRRIRLYLATVRHTPEPALVAAAVRSGGGVIATPR